MSQKMDDEMEFDDRRTFERFKLEFHLSCFQGNSPEKFHLHAHDISAEGMGVISDKKLFPGILVNMSFQIPGINKEFPAQGRVIWSKQVKNCFMTGITLERTRFMEISTILRCLHACPV